MIVELSRIIVVAIILDSDCSSVVLYYYLLLIIQSELGYHMVKLSQTTVIL